MEDMAVHQTGASDLLINGTKPSRANPCQPGTSPQPGRGGQQTHTARTVGPQEQVAAQVRQGRGWVGFWVSRLACNRRRAAPAAHPAFLLHSMTCMPGSCSHAFPPQRTVPPSGEQRWRVPPSEPVQPGQRCSQG